MSQADEDLKKKHEQDYVKQVGLEKLASLLRSRWRDLGPEGTLHQLVPDIVAALMSTLQCSDECSVVEWVGRCLGEVGAVDPGRLSLGNADLRPLPLLVPHFAPKPRPEWATALVARLGRSLLATPDPTKHDKCAYTLQEVLKALSVEPKDSDVIWSGLSSAYRSLIHPLFRSKFAYSREELEEGRLGGAPVFAHPQYGHTLQAWLSSWIHLLTLKMQNSGAQKVFAAVRFWLDSDIVFAEFLLPQVILQCLIEPNAAHTAHMCRDEVLAVLNSSNSSSSTVSSSFKTRSLQVVFNVYKFLTRWCKESSEDDEAGKKRVQHWLDSLPLDRMWKAAQRSGQDLPALLFFERHLAQEPQSPKRSSTPAPYLGPTLTPAHLHQLQKFHSMLGESDSVVGAFTLLREVEKPTDSQWILAYEATGDLTDALPFYQKSLERGEETGSRLGLVRCLLRLSQPALARETCAEFRASHPDAPPALRADMAGAEMEAAWKMTDWTRLHSLLEPKERQDSLSIKSWDTSLARIINCASGEEWRGFHKNLDEARRDLRADLRLGDAPGGSYESIYGTVCRLHSLAELESGAGAVLGDGEAGDLDSLLSRWHSRLHTIQMSVGSAEPILEVRRCILDLAIKRQSAASNKLARIKGKLWLESAKVARNANSFKTCHAYLVNAMDSPTQLTQLFLEEAKVLKAEGNVPAAISSLKRGIQKSFPLLGASTVEAATIKKAEPSDKLACAKALVLFSRYSWESGAETSDVIQRNFETAIKVCPEWESGHFRAAEFLDGVHLGSRTRPFNPETLVKVTALYVESLRHGIHHAHHSLPRLLTLWLDSAAKSVELIAGYDKRQKAARTKAEKDMLERHIAVHRKGSEKLTGSVRKELGRLPALRLFPAFAQLISRIVHPCPHAEAALTEILVRLIREFPDQALWLTISVYRSDPSSRRASRSKEVMEKAVQGKAELKKRFNALRQLSDHMLNFAPKNLEPGKYEMSIVATQLYKFFDGDSRSDARLLIPLESLMSAGQESREPELGLLSQSDPNGVQPPPTSYHAPAIYITGFRNDVTVMRSLQKPKLVNLRGSDGKHYKMMLKAGDDLRKDQRLMDFNAVVNAALRQDAEGRRRCLHVRRFGVTPLGPEGGMIEWVEDLKPLRLCLQPHINARGGGFNGNSAKTEHGAVNALRGNLPKLLQRYHDFQLPAHPRVLGQWFQHNFPEPSGWYAARLNYTRTCAVMSMVGFVLGLGDRHAENILLDLRSGDVFHVDFNLLFNKGENLNVPEIVPFRLTPNVVDGFGPLGVQGPFRTSSEVAMGILREKAGTLRTVMEAFLHDPLVEWARERQTQQGPTQGGSSGATIVAEEILGMMVQRLSGRNVSPRSLRTYLASSQESQSRSAKVVDQLQRYANSTLPLNVISQVDKLIEEATNPLTLSQMFFGWAPYL